MKQSLSVSIVIPNWNGKELLEKHLPGVIKYSKGATIIIVDDHSTDTSVAFLHTTYPEISVIQKEKHEGYATTVNIGAEKATTDIVVLLNTDIEPEKDFLTPLLDHFSDPNVFAVGCMDKSMEGEEIVLRGRGIGRWEKGFYIHKRGEIDKVDTAWVSGGSGAFRRSMWNTLGGMDPIYNPFYWEDIDLSYRARKMGYKIVFEPKSIVQHFHEDGKIKNEFTPSEIKRIAYRNQFIFIWNNATDFSILLSHIFWTPVRLLQSVLSGDFGMLHGYGMAIGKIGRILKLRSAKYPYDQKFDRELDIIV